MTKGNGLEVENNNMAGGVMAPTLRYHDGLFYIINFCGQGNYIVTAEDPSGSWSDPHWMKDVPGIDASIFFDDDGKCYLIGTGNVWENGFGEKERGFWAAEYDAVHFRMVGEPAVVWNGALRGGASPEAPHLYHNGEYYYLLAAEGGTEHYHSVIVARSHEVLGWYEGDPANPVLTHRHMGFDCPVTNVGHADLVQAQDGRWYSVMLASRQIDGRHKNLGRETFFCPVDWEREWPVFARDTGKVENEYEIPNYAPSRDSGAERDAFKVDLDFEKVSSLPSGWVSWGTPQEEFCSIAGGTLTLKCLKRSMIHDLEPVTEGRKIHSDRTLAFLGTRQRSRNFDICCSMRFAPAGKETAGIALVQAMNHQVRLEVYAAGKGEVHVRAVLDSTEYEIPPFFSSAPYETHEKILADADVTGWKKIFLAMKADGQKISFYAGEKEASMNCLAEEQDCSEYIPERIGTYTGTLMGIFASANGAESENRASFCRIVLNQNC